MEKTLPSAEWLAAPQAGKAMKAVEWRRAQVERRAAEMAKSGQYRDDLEIERALSANGYIEAPEWLDRASMRDDLNRFCRAHFGKSERA